MQVFLFDQLNYIYIFHTYQLLKIPYADFFFLFVLSFFSSLVRLFDKICCYCCGCVAVCLESRMTTISCCFWPNDGTTVISHANPDHWTCYEYETTIFSSSSSPPIVHHHGITVLETCFDDATTALSSSFFCCYWLRFWSC